ncbi:type IV pilus modification protein PilV [Pseudomonas sp. PDM23]|uniref:type IV pilus modification protein PilV n=1 Tax=unclassified Pseudomonas TaxID=196821 RepID=UPI00177E0CF8|nr:MULTISPECIES: type IV pilus modification protein PilV [unclassified Pseudomonas]MBD9501427.1 type IV pilus modification protein PilV [Pseudomonas sp. PDM17]MBD9576398.1 type IV pilus modification protein PilV [Pseudomonas sp. PDM23]MBD9670325.1 type IV pilus modification protein PilV [Pseudomonas sp. PDM21]
MAGGKLSEGFTLVEVLVSVLILGVGLLGLAGLQNVGISAGYSALQRSQASWLASEMADLLRANPDAARAGAYDTNFLDVAAGCPKSAGSTRAQLDLGQWQADVCETLGGTGSGLVQVAHSGGQYSALIVVRWSDRRARERLGEVGNAWETFTYRAGL